MYKGHLGMAALMFGLLFSQACKKKTTTVDSVVSPDKQIKGLVYGSVNGKAWNSDAPTKKHVVHYQDSFFSFDENIYGTECSLFGDTLTLNAVRVIGTDSSQLHMDIALKSVREGNYTMQSYPLKNAGKVYAWYYNKMGLKASRICKTEYDFSGTLNISNFTDSTALVSGTYSLKMTPKNTSNPKTPAFNITNGKFTDVYFGL